jgi:DNA-binding Lrp family transcriptional regulator
VRNKLALDAIDRAIIAELSEDGRLSNTELARRVRLTPAPCLRRVQRMERAGVIRGYHATIDPKSVGRGFEVIVSVDIAVNDGQTIEDFEAAATALPEVVEVRRMFGQPDFYLRVLVADHEEYEALTLNKLSRLPALTRFVSHQTMRLSKG